jgi:agmatinase
MFFHALGEGILDPEHSVHVGIRTHNDETHGFEILDAVWVRERGPAAAAQRVRERVGERKAYLTFDIDCLDPSVAPGTGTPVVGGLDTLEARQILWKLGGIDFVAMDMVEVAPPYDVAEATSLAAATLALDWLALRAEPRTPVGAA